MEVDTALAYDNEIDYVMWRDRHVKLKEECYTVPKMECKTEPSTVKDTVSKKESKQVDEQVCQKEPHDKYNDVPELVERQVPHWSCWDEPGVCEDIAR